MIPFRIYCIDLLAVQGTLKSFLQHHSSNAWILQCPTFFMVQLSHPYMTTGKPIALTIWTVVGKVMSLPFDTLSRFAISFLPWSKWLFFVSLFVLISWLQSPSAVILEPKKIKSVTLPFFLTHLPAMNDGTGCHGFNFWILSFKPAFPLFSFTFMKGLFSSTSFCH